MRKFINQDGMKQANFIDVFRLVKELGRITRKQIESITNLSWGAVSNITAQLIEARFLAEHKAENYTGLGRTPSYLEVDGSRHFVIGMDVNITGIQAELVNIRNESVKSWSSATDYSKKEALLACIISLLETVMKDIESESLHIMGIGIAMQGIVDAEQGISVSLSQCADWKEVPLAEILEDRFNIPVFLEHDPNCIMLACSENRDIDSAILLRVDRGIGMSVMLDGRVIGGMGMLEIGQTLAGDGCLEDYASMNGMEKLCGGSYEMLVKEAKEGKGKALSVFADMAGYLGTAIYNMQKIFHVSDVILCGEVMNAKELFMEHIRSKNPDTDFSEIDVRCASYGAAIIAMDQVIQNLKL